jgi:hypothetical protein
MLAYARYGATRMDDGDLDANFGRAGIGYQKIGGSPGNWNARYPGRVCILRSLRHSAFRGTEIDDPKATLYDADLVLVPEHDYRPSAAGPGPALWHLSGIAHLFSPPCLVHRGFQNALEAVWDEVHRIVLDYRAGRPGAGYGLPGIASAEHSPCRLTAGSPIPICRSVPSGVRGLAMGLFATAPCRTPAAAFTDLSIITMP